MFRRFLVPLDGFEQSERIGRWANGLAAGLGAEITLFGAVEPGKTDFGGRSATRPSGGWDDGNYGLEEARRYLSAVAQKLAPYGGVPQVEVAAGRTTDAILEGARLVHADTIALATRRVSVLARAVLGSVTSRIVLHSTIPVLVANPDALITSESSPDVPDTIIVPLDGSELSEKSVPYAMALAQRAGARIVFLRSTTMAFASEGSDDMNMAARECTEYLAGFQARAQEAGVTAECKVTPGNPAGAIIDTSKSEAGSIVVMTTQGRSGFRRAVLGSVADQVIRDAPTPVMVIPPTAD